MASYLKVILSYIETSVKFVCNNLKHLDKILTTGLVLMSINWNLDIDN